MIINEIYRPISSRIKYIGLRKLKVIVSSISKSVPVLLPYMTCLPLIFLLIKILKEKCYYAKQGRRPYKRIIT